MTTEARFERTVRFERPKPLTDYLDERGNVPPGDEFGGLLFPPHVLQALGVAKLSTIPCEFVVMGEEWTPDRRHYLIFGASREHIEAVTDYHHVENQGLHYQCPECLEWKGKHLKSCRGF